MDKDESWRVIDEQRATIADLLETLSDETRATPSLCAGWSVCDVGAHLSMAATMKTGELMRHFVRARGNFDRMIRDSAIDRARSRGGPQSSADLRAIIGSRKLAPSTFWRDPLLDLIVHGQDIARPLGLAVTPPTEATRVAADWVWQRRFPFFPSRRLRGLRLVADDTDWSRGTGPEVHGPVLDLLLLSTGRAAGLVAVHGPGAAEARRRFSPPPAPAPR